MPERLHKIAWTISRIQTTLEVYEGLFARVEDAEVILKDFNEIGVTIRRSLATNIIIGCAAIFTDPSNANNNENLSLDNLIEKYKIHFSNNTHAAESEIKNLVNKMNLKKFRNKHIGHFDLEAKLGQNHIERDITITTVRDLLKKGFNFINMIILDLNPANRDQLLGHPKIPKDNSTEIFLGRFGLNGEGLGDVVDISTKTVNRASS